MLMQAKVIKQTKGAVELATCPASDCGGCKLCRPRSEKLLIQTRKRLCRGQIVNLRINTAYFWRALGLLIFLPLVTLPIVLGVLLRCGWPEMWSALGALAVCFGEYTALYFYDRTIEPQNLYKIV